MNGLIPLTADNTNRRFARGINELLELASLVFGSVHMSLVLCFFVHAFSAEPADSFPKDNSISGPCSIALNGSKGHGGFLIQTVRIQLAGKLMAMGKGFPCRPSLHWVDDNLYRPSSGDLVGSLHCDNSAFRRIGEVASQESPLLMMTR